MPLGQGFGGFDFNAAQGGAWGSPLNRDAPYPVRQFAPQSGAVNDPLAGMGSFENWQDDWQNRYNAEQSRARPDTRRTVTTQTPQQFDAGGYMAANPDVNNPGNWNPEVAGALFPQSSGQNPAAFHYATFGSNEGRGGSNFNEQAYLDLNPDVAAAVQRGDFSSGLDHFGLHGRTEGRNVAQQTQTRTVGSAGYTPDFSLLNAERDQFEPLWQNQQRQQQAFNMMEGQGQRFGMMGEDYVNPGFGQVSGEVNPFSPDMGAGRAAVQGANDGISTDWLTGVYDPTQMQAMGVYRPRGSYGFGGM